MTTYGTEVPDLTDGNTDIMPANAEELGWEDTPPAKADAKTGNSLLDELLGLADEDITNVVYFPVTARKGGFVLGFDAVIGEPAIKRYRKAAQGAKKRVEDSETSVGNAMAMIETNTGIYKTVDGKRTQIFGTDGEPLLLNSDEFLNTYGPRQNAHAAVRKFLGDAETNTIGGGVLKAAGWGEDLEPLDPTDA